MLVREVRVRCLVSVSRVSGVSPRPPGVFEPGYTWNTLWSLIMVSLSGVHARTFRPPFGACVRYPLSYIHTDHQSSRAHGFTE